MSARGWSNFTPESYMLDEEREDDARITFEWRGAHPDDVPPRVTTPDRKAASIEAWRSAPAVRREYERGLRNGWIGAMAFYGVASAVLVLAFHYLGFRP